MQVFQVQSAPTVSQVPGRLAREAADDQSAIMSHRRCPYQAAALSIQRIAQLSEFSKRVACRLARSYAERDVIFKLRYQSCLRAGLISENSFGRYIEPADHAANTYLMGLYIDRRLVSSLRLQIGTLTTPICSSLELFPNVLEPLLRSNNIVVEMSCVATDGG